MDKSHVRNIKQRFENINHVNDVRCAGKNELSSDSRVSESEIKSQSSSRGTSQNIINDVTSLNSRPNIKRTPAFRRDKVLTRNNDLNDKTQSSIVSRRVHLFNNNDDVKPEKLVPSNNDHTSEEVKQGNIEKMADNIRDFNKIKPLDNDNDATETGGVPQLYSKVKKLNRNTKLSRAKKPPINNINSTNDSAKGISDKKVVKIKALSEAVRKLDSTVNKENKFSSTNIKSSSSDISEDLSDTLKRVLRSPLPPGPPPKKPPRTFTSSKSGVNETTIATSDDRMSNNSRTKNNERAIGRTWTGGSSVKEDPCRRSTPNVQPLVRSKTESEIKLRKIENALMKHQIVVGSPKLTARKISYSPPDCRTEKFASIHRSKRRSSDKGTLNQFTSCLSNGSCASRSQSVPYAQTPFLPVSCPVVDKVELAHIYEDPNKLNVSKLSSSKGDPDDSLYYMSTPIDKIIDTAGESRVKPVVEAWNTHVKMNSAQQTSLNEDFKAQPPGDVSIDSKIKFWMNEAYSKSWTKTSDASSDSDSMPSASQDEPKSHIKKDKPPVELYDDLTIIRKGYVQRVASRAVSRKQSALSQSMADSKHLFECLLLVGLNLDAHNEKVPYIKMKYPSYINVPQWIEHMCFPDAHDWSNNCEKTRDNSFSEDRCYVIPLTTEAGLRKYAYCRRMKPEGEFHSLPLSYCILSVHKATEFYFTVLEEIESRHGQSEFGFNAFIKELHENRFPPNGQGIRISSYSENEKEKLKEEVFTRPVHSIHEDLRLAKTLSFLKFDIFFSIFSSLLLERKVILLSNCISKMSTCIEGLQVALLPFEWQHTLITVVPSNLISVADLVDAPTPYLIGLLKPKDNSTRVLPQLNNKLQVLVVDLDEKKVMRKVGDENSILPNHLAKGLKNALQLAHSSEMHTNNLLAREAFTRFFVEAIGHYQRYIIVSGNGLSHRKSFQKEACVKAGSTHQIRMFLEWFLETASFAMFINVRLQINTRPAGLFEQRCSEYFQELNKSKYEKNKKLNKTVKQIGDLIKDWTTN